MKRLLLILLILAVPLSGAALASGCRHVVVQNAVVVKEVAVVNAVAVVPVVPLVATFVPYVTVPAYGSYYQAPPAYPQQAPAASPCAHLEQQLLQLRGEIDFLKRGQGVNPQTMPKASEPVNPAPTGGSVLANSCFACHAQSVAQKDGGGFTLDRQLTDKEKLKCIDKVYKGEMPPGGNKKGVAALTDEGFAKFLQEMAK